mgnify:CR=1 FL=1
MQSGAKLIFTWLGVVAMLWSGSLSATGHKPLAISSPSGDLTVEFMLLAKGEPAYRVVYKGKPVVETSTLGFDFKGAPSLKAGFKITGQQTREFNETWTMPWGEQREVVNHYRELRVNLQERSGLKRQMNLVFRVFDDGLGFRYEFPKQPSMSEMVITDENTQFQLTSNPMCWWQPGDWDSYEHLYSTTRFKDIDVAKRLKDGNLAISSIKDNAVNTPITMKTDDGVYLSFHEAALYNYPGITLQIFPDKLMMMSKLVGTDFGYRAKVAAPFNTPWRTIQVTDRAGELIESKLLVNLNEPNKLGDVSYVKPTKYVGIWWGMHLGIVTWDMASGRHGATTENAKKLIDFAAKNNIGAILVEGWNEGWEKWGKVADRESTFSYVTPYPDYDLKEVVRYGKEKGVNLIMHHETAGTPRAYERQLDTAYALMKSLDIHAVKTGYVGKILPDGEYHHGQWMVNHYQKVLETAAKYGIAVDAHEPIMATGIRRTYPNFISREGLRGQEFNAWSADGGNPPEHLTIIPFTRMLAGPIDYTPGIFDLKLKPYKPHNQVNTTLAQQLALYVVIYSPVQMAADLPQNYEQNPAFQFIRDVPVDWETSKVLDGEIGQYVTIARKERGGERWFVGSVTNGDARTLTIKLDFLDPGKHYLATVYDDGDDADWDKNSTVFKIENFSVDNSSTLTLKLAPGGGAAIAIVPKK